MTPENKKIKITLPPILGILLILAMCSQLAYCTVEPWTRSCHDKN